MPFHLNFGPNLPRGPWLKFQLSCHLSVMICATTHDLVCFGDVVGGDKMPAKEARVALSSLKRTCRTACLHGKLKLALTDNLSCLSAFEKGRASDPGLNSHCQIAASYSMGCGIRWRLRHIETKRNPADRDSRFDQEIRAPSQFPFDRGKYVEEPMQDAKSEQASRSSDCLARGVSAGALPISSRRSARAARRSTAVHGRARANTEAQSYLRVCNVVSLPDFGQQVDEPREDKDQQANVP